MIVARTTISTSGTGAGIANATGSKTRTAGMSEEIIVAEISN